MRNEIIELRAGADQVARLLRVGAELSREELDEVGSVAGTLRARLQYHSPGREVRTA